MNKIKLPKLECLRCNHIWHPRKEELPIRCPKCGSPYWNRYYQSSSTHTKPDLSTPTQTKPHQTSPDQSAPTPIPIPIPFPIHFKEDKRRATIEKIKEIKD